MDVYTALQCPYNETSRSEFLAIRSQTNRTSSNGITKENTSARGKRTQNISWQMLTTISDISIVFPESINFFQKLITAKNHITAYFLLILTRVWYKKTYYFYFIFTLTNKTWISPKDTKRQLLYFFRYFILTLKTHILYSYFKHNTKANQCITMATYYLILNTTQNDLILIFCCINYCDNSLVP